MSDSGKVVVKSVKSQWVAASLGVIPNYADSVTVLESLFTQTYLHAQANKVEIIAPAVCIFHDNIIREGNIPVETVVPIAQEIPGNEKVWIYQLPEVKNMASIVHQGSFDHIEEFYDTLGDWIKDNNYRINGSLREIYINYDQGGDNSVTEIQYPVEKINL